MRAKSVALAQRARVHQLGEHPGARVVLGRRDAGPRLGLDIVGQPRLILVTLGKSLVGVDPFRDDKAEATPREPQVVVEHGLRRHAIHVGTHPGHGCHGQAIAESHVFNIVRR